MPVTHRVPAAPGSAIRLAVDDYLPDGHRRGAAVFLPGFGSVRTGQKGTFLGRACAEAGIRFLALDYQGHGGSDGDFASLTLSRHLSDYGAVRDALLRDERHLLIGSSMGGLVATLAAARAPERLNGLALIAPAFGFRARFERRLGPAGIAEWERKGFLDYASDAVRRIGFGLLQDARSIDEDALVESLAVRTLLIHGTADETVPIEESERFAKRCRAPLRIVRVEGGSHRLDQHLDLLAGEILRFATAIDQLP